MTTQKYITLTPGQLDYLLAKAVKQGIAEYRRSMQSELISQREAFRRYGKACVLQLVAKGEVTGRRAGTSVNSKVLYDACEITNALMAR